MKKKAKKKVLKNVKPEGKPMKPKKATLISNDWGHTEKNSVPGINGSKDMIVP